MMNEISDDIFEYERPSSRLRIICLRLNWMWILATVLGLAFAIPFILAQFPSTYSNSSNSTQGQPDVNNDPALWKANILSAMSPAESSMVSSVGGGKRVSGNFQEPASKQEYKISGNDPTSLMNITSLEGLAASCEKANLLTSVSLSNVYLDAEKFSKALQGCENLQAISLVNVWLLGNFNRTYLPNLSSFTYVQNGADKRDSYKSPETLKQTLFFDKSQGETWSVEQDLLNLGVEISLWKAGTKLIDIQRQKGEIYLNVKYCESVLVNVQGSFEILTLINCNVTSASVQVIPATLKYLNIRNAVQRTPTLDELTQKLTHLEELYLWLTFHCNWPGYELYLNISSLPSTLKKLGINNVDTTYISGSSSSSSSIKELTIGDYITNKTISEGFAQLFPNLERINIVNVSDPTPSAGYKIISQAIKLKVKTIAVVNLHRNYSTTIENEQDIIDVESILDNSKLLKSPVGCYLIQLTANNIYKARKLSQKERHEVRYRGLGFDKMDKLDDYLKWDALS